MKKILIYSPGVFQKYGHSFDYCKGLSESFYDLGFEVHVFGISGPLQLPNTIIQKTIETASKRHKKQKTWEKIQWGIKRNLQSHRNLKEFKNYYLSFETKPLVIFETFEYFSLSFFANTFAHNYFCVFHDTNFNFKQTSLLAGIYKYLARFPSKKIIHFSKASFVHGFEMMQNLKQQLGKKVESKIVEIPYGSPKPITISPDIISKSKALLHLQKDKNYMLSFGTLRSDKKYEPILEALAKTSNWMWILAGPEGDYPYEKIKTIAERLQVQDKIVVFPQFIQNHEQIMYFAAADVIVNLYTDYIRHESGTVQLARTYNKPVIVSGPPDLTKYVDDLKIGWVLDDTTSLENVLKTFEEMPFSDKQEIQKNIFNLANDKSWGSVVTRILEFA